MTPGQPLHSRQVLIHKPKIQPPVPLLLPALVILLIRLTLLNRHRGPKSLFLTIKVLEILLLEDKGSKGEGADGDEDFIAAVVVGGVVCAVDFDAWEGSLVRVKDRMQAEGGEGKGCVGHLE